MKYTRFEQLPVWQVAIDLAIATYEFTSAPEFARRYSLRDQIERAAVSVSNNIAEGFERGSNADLIHFLYIARGSVGEVRSMLCMLEKMPALRNLESGNQKSHQPTDFRNLESGLQKSPQRADFRNLESGVQKSQQPTDFRNLESGVQKSQQRADFRNLESGVQKSHQPTDFRNLESGIRNLKQQTESISNQLGAWIQSLLNSDMKGQRFVTEKVREIDQRRVEREEFLEKLKRMRSGEQSAWE